MGFLKQQLYSVFGEYWYIIVLAIPIVLYYGYYLLRYLHRVPYEKLPVNRIQERIELETISYTTYLKLLGKKIVVWLLLIYSASFLAAVLPSYPDAPVANVIYSIGMLVYLAYFAHIVFFVYYFRRAGQSHIIFSDAGVVWQRNGQEKRFPLESKIEVSQRFGTLFLSDSKQTLIIPLFLIRDKDKREDLLELFEPLKPQFVEKGRQGLEIFESIIIALILAMHIRQFAVQAFYIPSGSMEMTLRIGDHLLVDKLALGPYFPPIFGLNKPLHMDFLSYSDIKRGDILIFRPPKEHEHREYIKRVIGLPGDTFEIKRGEVYINGQKLVEPYVNQHSKKWMDYRSHLSQSRQNFFDRIPCPMQEGTEYQGAFHNKVTIPEGKYLMLGDHRDNSSDSRSWGFVPRKNIRGKAWLLYFNYYDMFVRGDYSRLGLIQ